MTTKTVLIVDDEPTILMMLSDILQSNNIEIVAEATNGKDAVNLYKQHSPDIVLMDVEMPIKNGVQALKEILAINKTAKVIMVTIVSNLNEVENMIKIGAVGYITKPYTEEEVLSAIQKVSN